MKGPSRKDTRPQLPLSQHLLSVEYSGIYLTGVELGKVAAAIGESVPLKSREAQLDRVIRELFGQNESVIAAALVKVFEDRIAEYDVLETAYPAAKPLIETWRRKAVTTMNELPEQMKKAYDDSR